MIPVLIVPCLRADLVERMVASVDVPVGRWIILANGAEVKAPGTVHLPANLGVAASWNLGMKLSADAPWWFITNDDIVFAPGDLARLCDAMTDGELVTLDGFAAFGISRDTVERVGLFDENYMPAYVEDCDYEYRCRLAGVPIVPIPSNLLHSRSSTIDLPEYRRQNARTYPENVAYHVAKWGGPPRGGERFDSPFDGGGAPDEWVVSLERRNRLAWETTALLPEGETR